MKTLKSHNSFKSRRIRMDEKYAYLHINHPPKYENYQTKDIKAVALTKYSCIVSACNH